MVEKVTPDPINVVVAKRLCDNPYIIAPIMNSTTEAEFVPTINTTTEAESVLPIH